MKMNEWMASKQCWIVVLGLDYTDWALGSGFLNVQMGVIGMSSSHVSRASSGLKKIDFKPDFHVHEGMVDEFFATINTLAFQAWERSPGWPMRYTELKGKRWKEEKINAMIWVAKGDLSGGEIAGTLTKIQQILVKLGIERCSMSHVLEKNMRASEIDQLTFEKVEQWVIDLTGTDAEKSSKNSS